MEERKGFFCSLRNKNCSWQNPNTMGLISILFFLLLTFVSCGKSSSNSQGFAAMVMPGGNIEDVMGEEVPITATTFGINLTLLSLTTTEEVKMAKAISIIQIVVATDEFRQLVFNHTYKGVRTYVDNAGLSNEQIYQKILEGAESLQPYRNNIMDMEVEVYTDNSSNTVGHTYPSTTKIWVNTKYFNNYTSAGVAHNLFHEWLHKLGFEHAAHYSESRDHSVPYAIGKMIEVIGRRFL